MGEGIMGRHNGRRLSRRRALWLEGIMGEGIMGGKGYSTRYCLIAMLERFQKVLNQNDKFKMLLTN